MNIRANYVNGNVHLHPPFWQDEIKEVIRPFRTSYVLYYSIKIDRMRRGNGKMMGQATRTQRIFLNCFAAQAAELNEPLIEYNIIFHVTGPKFSETDVDGVFEIRDFLKSVMQPSHDRVKLMIARNIAGLGTPQEKVDKIINDINTNWDTIWTVVNLENVARKNMTDAIEYMSNHCNAWLYQATPSFRISSYFRLQQCNQDIKISPNTHTFFGGDVCYSITENHTLNEIREWLQLKENRILLYRAAKELILQPKRMEKFQIKPNDLHLEDALVKPNGTVYISFKLKEPKVWLTKKGRETMNAYMNEEMPQEKPNQPQHVDRSNHPWRQADSRLYENSKRKREKRGTTQG